MASCTSSCSICHIPQQHQPKVALFSQSVDGEEDEVLHSVHSSCCLGKEWCLVPSIDGVVGMDGLGDFIGRDLIWALPESLFCFGFSLGEFTLAEGWPSPFLGFPSVHFPDGGEGAPAAVVCSQLEVLAMINFNICIRDLPKEIIHLTCCNCQWWQYLCMCIAYWGTCHMMRKSLMYLRWMQWPCGHVSPGGMGWVMVLSLWYSLFPVLSWNQVSGGIWTIALVSWPNSSIR